MGFPFIAGIPVDNNQEDSSLTRSTLPRKIEDFIKTREKREINVVSNTTIQVCEVICSFVRGDLGRVLN